MDYVHELITENGKPIYKDIDGHFAETKYYDSKFRKEKRDNDRLNYMNLKYN